MRSTIRLMLLAVVAAPVLAFAQEPLKKAYADEDFIDILKNDGYRAVQKIDDRHIRIKVDGYNYDLLIYSDDDLQLYFGMTGYSLDTTAMNDWNRTKRLSRAYLDDENDPILEADLLANAGFTAEQFLEWFEVFVFSAGEYRQFLIQHRTRHRASRFVSAPVAPSHATCSRVCIQTPTAWRLRYARD